MPSRRKHNQYKQGLFKPINSSKYTGVQPVIYRSGLELSFYRWCDRNQSVIEWGSETIVIPYLSPMDGRVHRYFVDVNLVLKNKEGQLQKYLIEIKPFKQLSPPNPNHKRKRSTIAYESMRHAINQSKWQSAQQWCAKNGYQFQILTERDINPGKSSL